MHWIYISYLLYIYDINLLDNHMNPIYVYMHAYIHTYIHMALFPDSALRESVT